MPLTLSLHTNHLIRRNNEPTKICLPNNYNYTSHTNKTWFHLSTTTSQSLHN